MVVGDDSSMTIEKSDFQELKNHRLKCEPLEQRKKYGRKQHQSVLSREEQNWKTGRYVLICTFN